MAARKSDKHATEEQKDVDSTKGWRVKLLPWVMPIIFVIGLFARDFVMPILSNTFETKVAHAADMKITKERTAKTHGSLDTHIKKNSADIIAVDGKVNKVQTDVASIHSAQQENNEWVKRSLQRIERVVTRNGGHR